MKVRLTIMTENDKPLKDGITEEKIKNAWQLIFDLLNLTTSSDPSEKATVEKAEIVSE